MKNVSKLLRISRKILMIDWDMTNPNKVFRAHESISEGFQKLELALEV